MLKICPLRLAFLSACVVLTDSRNPLTIQPPTLVVEYESPASAKCSINASHDGLGWESSQGTVPPTQGVQQLIWTVQKLTDWDIKPMCYMTMKNPFRQNTVVLQVTVYKIPENVSISIVNHKGPMIEGRNYTLQCDITQVAPVQNLTVTWYKYYALMESFPTISDSKKPVNTSVNLLINPTKHDNGAKYWCEAKLKLGTKRPPSQKSSSLFIDVHYKPEISMKVEIIDSEALSDLNCTTDANPPPEYSWHFPSQTEPITTPIFPRPSGSGNYTCTVTNKYGKATKLFVIKPRSTATFWIILGVGLAVAVVLILGYLVKIYKTPKSFDKSVNHNNTSSGAPREELQVLNS